MLELFVLFVNFWAICLILLQNEFSSYELRWQSWTKIEWRKIEKKWRKIKNSKKLNFWFFSLKVELKPNQARSRSAGLQFMQPAHNDTNEIPNDSSPPLEMRFLKNFGRKRVNLALWHIKVIKQQLYLQLAAINLLKNRIQRLKRYHWIQCNEPIELYIDWLFYATNNFFPRKTFCHKIF